jgi:hypothetical protein
MRTRIVVMVLALGSTVMGGCTMGDPGEDPDLALARQGISGTVVFPDDSCSPGEQDRIRQGFELLRSQITADSYGACLNEAFFASTSTQFPEAVLSILRTDFNTKVDCEDSGGTGWWPSSKGNTEYGNEHFTFSKQWLTPTDGNPPCGKEGIAAVGAHEVGHSYYFVHKGNQDDIEYNHSAPVFFNNCSWRANSTSRPYDPPGRSFLTHETTLATVGFHGGEPFDLSCSMDAMLNGLNVTWDGVHITSLATSCRSPFGRSGWWNGVFGPAGDTVGTPYALRCAQDEVAVGLTGANLEYLRQIDVLCVNRDVWKNLPPSTEYEANKSLTHAAGAIGAVPGGSYPWSRLCPPGMAIKNVRGRAGTRIDQLEISCQRIQRDTDVKLNWLAAAGSPANATARNLELCAGHAAMTGLIIARTSLSADDKGPDDPAGVVTRLGGWCETVSWDASEHLSQLANEQQLVEPEGEWTNWKSEDACAAGQALVGLKLWASTTINAIQGLCAPISDWANPSIANVVPAPTPKRGGNTGTAAARTCARGEFLFGWMIESGKSVQRIWPICRRMALVPPAYAPAPLTASLAPGQILLSWGTAAEASRYVVKRSATSASGPFTTIASNVTATSYVDTALVPGTTFYYVVAGANSAGVGPDSLVASATATAPTALPSDVPTNVVVGGDETAVFYADNWPSKGNPYWTANIVLSVNSLSGWAIPPGTARVNGVSYSFGGKNLHYEVIDIPDQGPYTIVISSTSAANLQIQLANR